MGEAPYWPPLQKIWPGALQNLPTFVSTRIISQEQWMWQKGMTALWSTTIWNTALTNLLDFRFRILPLMRERGRENAWATSYKKKRGLLRARHCTSNVSILWLQMFTILKNNLISSLPGDFHAIFMNSRNQCHIYLSQMFKHFLC